MKMPKSVRDQFSRWGKKGAKIKYKDMSIEERKAIGRELTRKRLEKRKKAQQDSLSS